MTKESGFSFDGEADDDMELQSLGLVDSMMMISIMAYCEARFECAVDPDDFTEENFRSIRTLSQMIAAKLAAQ